MKIQFLLPLLFLFACGENAEKSKPAEAEAVEEASNLIGKIERFSPELDGIIPADAKIEVIGRGLTWAEGPVWVTEGGYLLFSDVPENKIYRYDARGGGFSLFLTPSGCSDENSDSPEKGANGLALDAAGHLYLCQHGDRRIAQLDAPLNKPEPKFITKADKWNGKRFNSPNDLVFDKNGNLYFTDPPYGLNGQTESPKKEIPFQGVYLLRKDGKVVLLDSTLTRPNGIALSPDGKTLIVANSDPEKALWKAYDVNPDGTIANSRIFMNMTGVNKNMKGLPDGLKISQDGIVFATGPGGVYVFKMDATPLGRIDPGEATANCAIGGDGYLYLTSDMYLCRVKLVR